MFDSAMVNGIPLLFVVMGIVSWLKKAGVSGNMLLAASLFVGVLLGVGYLAMVSFPVTFADWFQQIVYGLALGLTASGVVDAVRPQKE
jgi:hypothetical protein